MTVDFAYDPVTAIEESSAVGDTAMLFAEIRQTMAIPLVTSIWRGLAGMDDSLALAWAAAKPIYESGEPERALMRSIAAADLPGPEPLAPTALACVGLTESDIIAARTVIAAYNRSNGLNLMALAAFVALPVMGAATPPASGLVATLPTWPPLPPLLPREATLWRHLAHWPAFLALIHGAFAPLQSRQLIGGASARLVALAAAEGERMAHLLLTAPAPSRQALSTITGYVTSPSQVARMVTIGHALSDWLDR